MAITKYSTDSLLALVRDGKEMRLSQQLWLVANLSFPAILAQISTILMEYIDASMVGHLGENESAAIGIVATTIWLFWGLCYAVSTGFSVQVAQLIGAGDTEKARSVLRQSIVVMLVFSFIVAAIGVGISGMLPLWLGGGEEIHADASLYFCIFAVCLPILQFSALAGGMLRCSGNMKVPSMLNILMCVLDVIFNFLFIFPTREITLLGISFTMPGANLGVAGAAWGTALAEFIAVSIMLWYLLSRSSLSLKGHPGRFLPTRECIVKALHISTPMGLESGIMSSAQILITAIVAPLGTAAIAANSFAISVESLCYMPGHGIADAATTIVGQSIGAGRKFLARRFAHITVFFGMAVMAFMGFIMYETAPLMMSILTNIEEIQILGTQILRIEAFAEPMFAAAIVAYGVFVGAGDTLIPCTMNLGSIWAVRLTLAFILAPIYGLQGVWIAMCIELCFRGIIFLIRMQYGNWAKKVV